MTKSKKQSTTTDKDKTLRTMVATNRTGKFFGVSQDVLDQVWHELTSPEGNSVTYISMEIGADPDVFHPIKNKLVGMKIKKSADPELNHFINRFLNGPEKIPNYGGGLGILAGDTLKSFADCKIPVVGISLLYRKGYFSQLVDSNIGQVDWTPEWSPWETPGLYLLKNPDNPDIPIEIEVPFYDLNDKEILTTAQLWLKIEVNEDLDYFVPEILLDYNTPSSPDWIKDAAQTLYDSSSEKTQVIQRRLLGAGIIPTMKILGITSKSIHLNEQHGVGVVINLIIETLRDQLGENFREIATDEDIEKAAKKVSERVVYTIHTPVKAGHDRYAAEIYKSIGHSFCQKILRLLASDEERKFTFNFTALAMRVNRATNSVSRLHKKVTQKQFPQYADKITAITNGVHHLTWISDAKAELYDSFKELENWRHDPSVFANAKQLIANKKFRNHLEKSWLRDTQTLIMYINQMLSLHRKQREETWIDPPNFLSYLRDEESLLDPNVYSIGFARRFSTYKRADLVFEDLDALLEIITAKNWPVNFIFAGKAHPADKPGQELIRNVLDIGEELYNKSKGLAKLVFLPGYDMALAKMMVSGVHAWLNSPKRPLEASGTSGMKVAMNGIPNISIMDGWWAEGYHEGQAGWKFGYEDPVDSVCLSEDASTLLYEEDSASFYKVFPEILETFYDPHRRQEYIDKCIMNLALNCPVFNTHRMAAEYIERYNLNLPKPIAQQTKKFLKLYCSDSEFSS